MALESLRNKVKEQKENLQKKKDEIFQLFGPIAKAIKKSTFENNINAYIDNPYKALLDDQNLEITNALETIKKKIKEISK